MLQSWSWPPFDPDCCRCEFVSFGEGLQSPAARPTVGLQVTQWSGGELRSHSQLGASGLR